MTPALVVTGLTRIPGASNAEMAALAHTIHKTTTRRAITDALAESFAAAVAA